MLFLPFLFPQRPPITPDSLDHLISKNDLKHYADTLYSSLSGEQTRAIGTSGFNLTTDLILNTLNELSSFYTYEIQPFVCPQSIITNHSIKINNTLVESFPFKMTPKTDVSGEVVFVDFGCTNSDFVNTNGKVVIAKSGECAFGLKSELAGLANAKALLIYDPELNKNEIKRGTLGTPSKNQVATLGIRAADLPLFWNSKVSVFVDAEVNLVNTFNIIAQTKQGDPNNVVFSGAHIDSVVNGLGMNDNGSGLISQLVVMQKLTNFELKNAARFAFWSAEENGLVGSLFYTENLRPKEVDKIRMFLDYDMLASVNYIYEIYDSNDEENPRGSAELRDMFINFYKSKGFNYTLQPFDGRSDYVGFVNLGIPSCGVDSGVELIKTSEEVEKFGGVAGRAYDECYHLECDDIDNINYEPWVVNTRAMAHAVAKYTASMDKFPRRNGGRVWVNSEFNTK